MTTIDTMRTHGIVYPEDAQKAAKTANIPLSALCAVLMSETGGGKNVFGHDPVKRGQVYGGRVTRLRYLFYKVRRRLLGNQGVGPCQLTSPGLQDQADKRGGCWKPLHNMEVGALFLASLNHQYGSWELAFQHYNGSGPAAVLYGGRTQHTMTYFHLLFAKD